MPNNIVPVIEETKNEELIALYEEYKKSEDYNNYVALIQNDKPNLSKYLIDIIMYGYWYETFLENLPEEERKNYTSILDREEKVMEPVKGDMKGVGVYESEELYKQENPNLTEIKTIGEPLTFQETKLLENEIIN
jgi:hypothetical protein